METFSLLSLQVACGGGVKTNKMENKNHEDQAKRATAMRRKGQ